MRETKQSLRALDATILLACQKLGQQSAPPMSVVWKRDGRYWLSWARYQGNTKPGSAYLFVSKPDDVGTTLEEVRDAIRFSFARQSPSRLVLVNDAVEAGGRQWSVLDLKTLAAREFDGERVWTFYADTPDETAAA